VFEDIKGDVSRASFFSSIVRCCRRLIMAFLALSPGKGCHHDRLCGSQLESDCAPVSVRDPPNQERIDDMMDRNPYGEAEQRSVAQEDGR
jgi:hypothetical protein